MKIRKFNESISKEMTGDYIEDLFQSFIDDNWYIEINDCFYVGEKTHYNDIYLNDGILSAKELRKGTSIEIKRLGETKSKLTSLKEFDSLVDYIPDFRSKLQTMIDDGYNFKEIIMTNFESIHLFTDLNEVLLDSIAIQKLNKLVENGFPKIMCEIIGKNRIEMESPSGNNTQFAKLWKYRISKEHKKSLISPEFEKWFDSTFKITEEFYEDNGDDNEYEDGDKSRFILNIL